MREATINAPLLCASSFGALEESTTSALQKSTGQRLWCLVCDAENHRETSGSNGGQQKEASGLRQTLGDNGRKRRTAMRRERLQVLLEVEASGVASV